MQCDAVRLTAAKDKVKTHAIFFFFSKSAKAYCSAASVLAQWNRHCNMELIFGVMLHIYFTVVRCIHSRREIVLHHRIRLDSEKRRIRSSQRAGKGTSFEPPPAYALVWDLFIPVPLNSLRSTQPCCHHGAGNYSSTQAITVQSGTHSLLGRKSAQIGQISALPKDTAPHLGSRNLSIHGRGPQPQRHDALHVCGVYIQMHVYCANRARRQSGFPTFISCQRQDPNVLPKRRQSHQGDKLCDVSTVLLVARWPVFLARGSDADGEPHLGRVRM